MSLDALGSSNLHEFAPSAAESTPPASITTRSGLPSRYGILSTPAGMLRDDDVDTNALPAAPRSPARGSAPKEVTSSSSPDTLVYGLLPQRAVEQLEHDADWRVRSAAIDEVFAALAPDVLRDRVPTLLPHVAPLLAFLGARLLDDHFKVVLTALQCLSSVVAALGPAVKPHLRTLLPMMLTQLGDSKSVLKQAVFRILVHLMTAVSPSAVLAVAMHFLNHDHPKIKEETVNVAILAMLKFTSAELDVSALVADLLPALRDPKPKVKYVAIEALAVLAARTSLDRVVKCLVNYDADDETLCIMRARAANTMLPTLAPDGVTVEHLINLRSSTSSPIPGTAGSVRSSTTLAGSPILAPSISGRMRDRSIFAQLDTTRSGSPLGSPARAGAAAIKSAPTTMMGPRPIPAIALLAGMHTPTPRSSSADLPAVWPSSRSPAPPIERARSLSPSFTAPPVVHDENDGELEPVVPHPPATVRVRRARAAPMVGAARRYGTASALSHVGSTGTDSEVEEGDAAVTASIPPTPAPTAPSPTKLTARASPTKLVGPPATKPKPAPAPKPATTDELRVLITTLKTADWEQKLVVLETMQSAFTTASPAVLTAYQPVLMETVHAIVAQVQNLRTAVARPAIATLSAFVHALPRELEPYADTVLASLFKKSADAKDFISEAVTAALMGLPAAWPLAPRVLPVLVAHADARAPAVRGHVAALLAVYLAETCTPVQVQKVVANPAESAKLVPALVALLRDGAGPTRAAARRAAQVLDKVPGWRDAAQRHVSPTQWADVVKALAAPAPAAASVAAGPGSARVASAPAEGKRGDGKHPPGKTARGRSRSRDRTAGKARDASHAADADEKCPLTADELIDQLGNKDWKLRQQALHHIPSLLRGTPSALPPTGPLLSRFMDAFTDRLRDGNQKVCAHAMDIAAAAVLPVLGARLDAYSLTLVPPLAAAAAASNASVRTSGMAAVDALCAHVDPAAVVPALGHVLLGGTGASGGAGGGSGVGSSTATGASGSGSTRARAFLLRKIGGLVETTHPPLRLSLVLKASLVPALRVLASDKDRGSDAESAAADVVRTLYNVYGARALYEAAPHTPGVTSAAEVVSQLKRWNPVGGSAPTLAATATAGGKGEGAVPVGMVK
ncbi:hypothetical protein AMAG_07128 [Allomyces macrogynus ATCC 38327]|uniref:TOG domain-containing protein n=1 Tax=Allomyces macrogynus (strain ATCC 38327) TaxID=578462 RepID=A0A0L0SH81_ALLM3|nr:hypothetical protein AMAG_07128 [Allomyces macrogynus ATCC 38327]|eukprot:KNE61856.1 hypothetical protein AMAG_07128 [Allomyces macrogynus ATCC 38327]